MKRSSFIFFILITTLVAGLNYPIGKMGLAFSSPYLLLSIRFLGAFLLMLPFIWKLPHPKQFVPWMKIAIIGLFQSTLVLGMIYFSMRTITSGNASILSSTNPIWLVIIQFLLLGIRYRALQWIGVLLGFAGVFLTQGMQLQFESGDLIALLAGIFWATATLLIKHWGKTINTWVMTAYQMGFGGIFLLIASMFLEKPMFDIHAVALPELLFVMIYLIIMSSIVQFVTWFYLIGNNDPAKVSSFLFLVPLIGTIGGWLILNEVLHWYVGFGAVFIGVGIYLVNRPAKKQTIQPTDTLSTSHLSQTTTS
ncbi:EamA family transporter [Shimazuella sp. AN120528]|uniref:DMT family transporter n=1 Tax=Shimazuella soli TaxID=1892854 RepID=UPI001F106487|nr:EamA family transporter [Shimazuella soli]MCH5584098.1 EamA family transporter [Shimazuella soli]